MDGHQQKAAFCLYVEKAARKYVDKIDAWKIRLGRVVVKVNKIVGYLTKKSCETGLWFSMTCLKLVVSKCFNSFENSTMISKKMRIGKKRVCKELWPAL